MLRRLLLIFVLASSLAPRRAEAADVRGVVKASLRTVGYAVRDTAWTVGRTVRSLFRDGPDAAARTARANARATGADARHNAARLRQAAHH